ncbi:MAG: glycosyltransferase family 39 protein [Anaerolineales bacterium]|nr:glycosyltransferase family 39 protein [Anaerolineales bacterium]
MAALPPGTMREPSLLDFLKALFSGRRMDIPAAPQAQRARPKASRRPTARAAKPARVARPRLPWMSLAAFLLFLLGQALWTPPGGNPPAGVLAALGGLGLALAALRKGEWRLAPTDPAGAKPGKGPLSYRRTPLLAGLALFALAFLFSGNNQFNLLNVSAWLASLVLVLYAFWQFDGGPQAAWARKWAALWRGEWTLRITQWSLLLLAAFAVIAFFRFSQLSALPAEMISDQAEKLLDVRSILNGEYPIFFERNTGREPLQFYLAAAIAGVFGTGLSFTTLKISMAVLAFAGLVYVYLLGEELGGPWLGLFALLLVGLGFWPNLLPRVGLRFALYPVFAAPVLLYLIRGLRRGSLNDMLLSGLFLGLGLNGYSAFRIMPLVVAVGVLVYWLHTRSAAQRQRALIGLVLLGLVCLVVCTPLLRYALEQPENFTWRMSSRLLQAERPYPEPVGLLLVKNFWNAIRMFNYSGGSIWLVGLSGRPAFDTFSAALLLLGGLLAVHRYRQNRSWVDLYILLCLPLMLLPSMLSLAFPEENPAMNRASGAWVPAFLLAALGLDALLRTLRQGAGRWVAVLASAGLLLALGALNARLFFGDYIRQYDGASWNHSELGQVIADYAGSFGSLDSAWVVAYPHWADTRLVAMNAGNPGRDYGIWPDQLADTLGTTAPKLFLLKPEDEGGLSELQALYPNGLLRYHQSRVPGKEFLSFFVPAQAER